MAEYEVGYGKPPQHGRFVKGQSGNPRGRTKQAPSMGALLRRELQRKVTIVENGRKRRITLEEAALRQVATKAAKGETKSLQMYFSLRAVLEAAVPTATAPLHENDEAVLANLTQRLLAAKAGEHDDEPA